MTAVSKDSFDTAAAEMKDGRVAIVTGGADGFGKSFSHALLKKKAKGLCIADFNETTGNKTLRELAEEFGEDRVMFVKCDVTSQSEFEDVFKKTKAKFGCINLVVNNAGIMNEDNWEKCVDTNLKGTMRGTKLAIRYMGPEEGGEGGMVINVASMAGLQAASFMPTYTATKFASVGWTRALQADPCLKAIGITFGALCPAFANTAIIDGIARLNSDVHRDIATALLQHMGLLEVDEVTDSFLRLVLDKFWEGKVLGLTKLNGIVQV
ncbi:15-hydroxyprostaglandin dehydrogenase [NAD(+)]-like [Asterias rubens]|uniref:15-hydroxyprostaglandin dehydrogenase [NAD(+)]-like n=1 Tax=Asterias rubens TaxID=7604 RepID=UPI0014558436|nr:15-hydroxyprostaglandin dehydrogenase [NAD(+)]-like [Asterias rubens]